MTTPTTTDHAATDQRVLVRSAAYEALALAFAYPDAAAEAGLRDLLADLVEHETTAALGLLASLEALGAALDAAQPPARAAEHTRLFDNETLCTPFETDYQADPFAKASQLADIAGFYQAWGVDVSRARPTTPDFIGSEFEFMSLIARKQAYAAARGWDEQEALARRAQRVFLQDHLGRWIPAFTTAVAERAGTGSGGRYFVAAAAACARLVAYDVAVLGVRPVPLRHRMVGGEQPLDCPFAAPAEEPELIPLDEIEVALPRGDAPPAAP
jgi:TorA maturation chaperone TorD